MWDNIIEAEKISTKRKMRNPGVIRHMENRLKNLTEIQKMILEGRMHTDEYMHEQRISGQNKLRDIAKLHFHPSHIQHRLLTMIGNRRVDRCLIRHTYASRKGYGQIACAMQIKKDARKYRGQIRWYGQGDICKYYDNIHHCHIREDLEHLFKDKKFVDAYMEPFERFTGSGIGIPLGIRPSQCIGNLTLSGFDHFMTEEVKAHDYKRYLDDFIFTGATKGEVKWKMKRAAKYLETRGFILHVPKIHRICEGIDMMGFVFYGVKNDGWWRKNDKVRWLRHRSKVTNPKRLMELDYAAWGMLKWGNSHCKRLWCMKTGRKLPKKKYDMGIKYKNSGISRTERKDVHGVPFIDEPKISMQLILGKLVVCDKWVGGVTTSHGPDRYAIRVNFMGSWYKVIVNAVDIKTFLDDMTRNKVTKFRTVFVDKGSLHYGIDEEQTEIIEVDGRMLDVNGTTGEIFFCDNNEVVKFS